MTLSTRIRSGGCLCGAARYTARGEPLRVGLCHCSDCCKSSGSVFVAFAVWPRSSFYQAGETSTYAGRSFCPRCGERLFCLSDRFAEVRIGSLDDAPNDLQPIEEIWIKRRETWLHPIEGAGQYEADAFDAMDPTKN
ncbi:MULTISPECIES: GFA family protein [Rhizobium]|uniref:GFA family protein n=1 Tax=Rhizobium TaxID=379 RepID=UPI0009EB9CAD|nr:MULTISPECIES: GFA family protein [Rhizobium]MCA0801899.1 GFA family protein [Rhizobium sp. T1473]MCS0461252.1 GFA family protein [Rhizobium favelukesii]UFS84242.1 GFA family protein [Rhizobium sp. T136]